MSGVLRACFAFLLLATPSSEALAGRRALIELGLPPAAISPAESVLTTLPHPWPGLAMLCTAAGIAAPIAIAAGPGHEPGDATKQFAVASLVFTPAAGHVYGGVTRRALRGVVVRAAGLVVLAAASGGTNHAVEEGSAPLALLGLTLMGASALWDVFTVASDVEAANLAHARARLALGFVPGAGGSSPTLAVRVRF